MPILHEQVVFPKLEELELSAIASEEMARSSWTLRNIQPSSRFQNLSCLTVNDTCKGRYLFSLSTATSMVQLKSLKVSRCKYMEEIILLTENAEEGKIASPIELFPLLESLELKDLPILKRFCIGHNIQFPKLTSLKLIRLPKLKRFSPGAPPSKWSSLKLLWVCECKEIEIFVSKCSSFQETFEQGQLEGSIQQPLFVVEEGALPNLEILAFDLNDTVWPGQYLEELFCKLKHLSISGGIGSGSDFPPSTFIERLQNLEILEVWRTCWEEIFSYEVLVDQEKRATTLTNLRRLHLQQLPMLTHLWEEYMQPCPVFQKLEILKVFECGKLRNLVPSSVSFQNLTNIEIWKCDGLIELVTSSTAKSLVQLQQMSVTEYERITEIVAGEGSEADEVITFSKLTLLKLDRLPKLTNFCSKSYSFMFPSLEQVIVRHCPEMEIFCAGVLSAPMLERVVPVALEDGDRVLFPQLRKLVLDSLPKLCSFLRTQSVLITGAEEITPGGNLDFRMPILHEQVVFPKLEELELSSIALEEMARSSWTLRNIQPSSRFQNLSCLTVNDTCKGRYLFSLSTATSMVQLKSLKVSQCKYMEEIILLTENVDEEGKIANPIELFPLLESLELKDLPILKRFCIGHNIQFPKLISLKLLKLPKLKRFSPGARPSKWSLLKLLWVGDCKEIEIFASKYSSFHETFEQGQLEGSVQQPLFVVEEGAFPNLVNLSFDLNDTIWPGQHLEELFCKLEVLSVGGHYNGLAFSPCNFIGRQHNLKIFHVARTCWEEIFSYEVLVDQEKCATTLTNLRELRLQQLPMLTHLWKEYTQPCPVFHKLEILKVFECGKLRSLVPSSVSFQNLTNLEIWKCDGLIELVTSSTAKSLVQLQKMSVTECERITEIVAGEGSEADEVITFSKLTHLELDWLPRLTKFYSGNNSFMFPSLEEVIVRQCPEMKIFCAGVLSTPNLKRVQAIEDDKWIWKDDLNTTIHWLWEGSSIPIH